MEFTCQLNQAQGTISCTEEGLEFVGEATSVFIAHGHLYAILQSTPTLLQLHHLDPTTLLPTTSHLHIDSATPFLTAMHAYLPPPPKNVHIYCNPTSGRGQSLGILSTI